jgi:hypothetical protein
MCFVAAAKSILIIKISGVQQRKRVDDVNVSPQNVQEIEKTIRHFPGSNYPVCL